MSVLQLIENIIRNVLHSLYQYFFAAVIVTILFMFFYMSYQDVGFRKTVRNWVKRFREQIIFRYVFFLTFYVSLILMRTILCRALWVNPVENVLGIWGIWRSDGTLYTENIENVLLFLPFSILYLVVRNADKSKKSFILQCVLVSFLFSLAIEFVQLFLKLGTWQLSDLFYNTLGGFIGGLMYSIGYQIKNKK